MLVADDIVVNPEEAPMVPARSPVSLSELGISVVEFRPGESSIEGTSIRTATGQRLVDRKGKTTTVEMTLEVAEDADVDLPAAAYRLQQMFGSMQERETWIMRVPYVGGDFAGPILYKITGVVALGDFGGWGRGEQPDVKLVLERDPVGYSTEEDESEEFKTSAGARQLIYSLGATGSSAEGLKRIHIVNSSTRSLRGVIWAEECRDAPDDLSDPTADLAYLAKNLTPQGGAEVKTISGAEVVQHTALSDQWLAILDSTIAGVGEMTHRGARQLWMRVYDPGEAPGGVELRVLSRAFGASRWVDDGPIVGTPLVDDFALLDMGTLRPQYAPLGEDRWQFRVIARAAGGSGAIRLRDVYPAPTESYAYYKEPLAVEVPTDLAARDDFEQSAGALTGKTAEVGGVWKGAGDPDDFQVDAANDLVVRTSKSDDSPGRIATLGEVLTDTMVQVEVKWDATSSLGPEVGPVARFENADNFAHALIQGEGSAGVPRLYLASFKAGSLKLYASADLPDLAAPDPSFYIETRKWVSVWLMILGSGEYAVWVGAAGPAPTLRLAGRHADFAEGVLADGEAGIRDAHFDSVAITRYFRKPVAWAPEVESLCYPKRALELRSDGPYRQHPVDDEGWGKIIEEGFRPVDRPSGLELRPTRGIIIPSHGDLDRLPDSPTPSLEARVYRRAGHLVSREPVV
jgi:hypothetical protein